MPLASSKRYLSFKSTEVLAGWKWYAARMCRHRLSNFLTPDTRLLSSCLEKGTRVRRAFFFPSLNYRYGNKQHCWLPVGIHKYSITLSIKEVTISHQTVRYAWSKPDWAIPTLRTESQNAILSVLKHNYAVQGSTLLFLWNILQMARIGHKVN